MLRCVLLAGLSVAQVLADDDGGAGTKACPPGHSRPPKETKCVPDPCNVEESIRAPRHGSLGTCGPKEFEFVHLRPDPIDESDVSIASLSGALATVGIPFKKWVSSGRGLTFDNGAVFWTNPERGPSGDKTTGIQVAQLTIKNGALFSARMNFQGRTTNGCQGDNVDGNTDTGDGCQSQDYFEDAVEFTNDPEKMKHLTRSYEWLVPSVAIIAGGPHKTEKGIKGYTTYKLIVHLHQENDARNVYAIFGNKKAPGHLPPVYQVTDPGFGADIGGTHHSLWKMYPESQFDSYLTLGTINMDHPDVLDNLHLLGDGESCKLACNTTAGYQAVGDQPTCKAGVVKNTVECLCMRDEPCDGEFDSPAQGGGGSRPGKHTSVGATTTTSGGNSDGGGGVTSGKGGGMQMTTAALVVVAAVVLLGGLLAAKKGMGRTSIMPSDPRQSAAVMAAAGAANTVNSPSPIFGGFTIQSTDSL